MLIAAVPPDLCLAYANTLSWRGSDAPAERLTAFGDLLGWLESSAGFAAAAVEEIGAWSREHPKKAATVFAEAIAVREAVYRIFAAFAGGEAVRDQDFAALKERPGRAPARSQLARGGGSYAWRIEPVRPTAPDLLAPVLWSAGDLVLNAAPVSHPPVRQREMPVAVRRREQERDQALVRHGLLRQPRQGPPPLLENQARALTGAPSCKSVAQGRSHDETGR